MSGSETSSVRQHDPGGQLATEGETDMLPSVGRRNTECGVRHERGAARHDRCALGGGAGRAPQVVGGLLYVTMIALGTATVFIACRGSFWKWVAAGAYCTYAPAAGLLFAIRGCAHCAGRPARSPSGEPANAMARGFWLHLPLLLPTWLVPLAASAIAVWLQLSWPTVVPAVAFAVIAFGVLPLVARNYICPRCSQRNFCPWMRGCVRSDGDAQNGQAARTG